jgi:hypothetical protein
MRAVLPLAYPSLNGYITGLLRQWFTYRASSVHRGVGVVVAGLRDFEAFARVVPRISS